MNYEILPIVKGDFKYFIPPLFRSMGFAHFVATLWPDNQTDQGQQRAIERFMAEMDDHPGIRWIKAVDSTAAEADGSPKIVGIAQWAIFEADKTYHEVPHYAPGDLWPNKLEKDYAIHLWESYIQPRRAVLRKENLPVVNLQILCVWPEYRKHGAGGQLVDWGNRLADEMNAQCIVEASGMGQPLYEKFGYEVKEQVGLKDDARFNDRMYGKIHIFMARLRREPI
ncbi:hypothetical protein BU24DRAFT_415486 [Aaosphaeria arxii CBS 175.79]|uniref:N-acetyltransferase domain-containing protein n=1 Tax=Aaosphaeria arxii CBS 175.79 TaxID=1450172 RepID=A0A6A5X7E3_9PLEO|nr:uncharacterized protein BU24DRAFT_415486 [Aaosphaeria arxii CBS 175.79]KAF2008737.1 hypothetical protein BU24DRAFT_415486 [Aaosphaeria arxii CBS 175.79]